MVVVVLLLVGSLQKTGDRGTLARASGDYAIVVAHNPDAGITRIKLPSGTKKVRGSGSSRVHRLHGGIDPGIAGAVQQVRRSR